jgi:hypothetical protein
MIKSYPLYDSLCEKVNNRKNVEIDIKLLCNNINNISNNLQTNDYLEHYNEICALIIHHYIKSNIKINTNILPYGSKIMFGGKGILFNFVKFDPYLQQILAQYICDN